MCPQEKILRYSKGKKSMLLLWAVWGKSFKYFQWVGRTFLASRYVLYILEQGESGYGCLQLDIFR